jgi:2-polyprenyl-3-methyl-5-hydroxy-6-metoxy-1,4-benzoquinol methylase
MSGGFLARFDRLRDGGPPDSANGPPEQSAAAIVSHTLQGMRDEGQFKTRQRAMWALGDYHSFATASLWSLGPLLVAACGISPGQRVLDVAAGTGNVAIRAAEAGADVVASDLTPENFDAGRREASAHGVQLEWVEADAEALPFGDGEFDVVTSAAGAIFAPHHQRVADELLRVCRPGGTIGLIAIVPAGAVLDLFEIVARYEQAPMIAAESPLQWGNEEHVRELFGDRVKSLSLERRPFAPDPLADIERFKSQHPMFVALHRDLADQPDRAAALDRELAELMRRRRGEGQELLLIVARKRDQH